MTENTHTNHVELARALTRASWHKSSYSGSESNCVEVAPLRLPGWRTSSYSGDTGNCVEVAPLGLPGWRTSSHSGSEGNCVEVARGGRVVAVRDSKDPDGPKLAFSPAEWNAFTSYVRRRTAG